MDHGHFPMTPVENFTTVYYNIAECILVLLLKVVVIAMRVNCKKRLQTWFVYSGVTFTKIIVMAPNLGINDGIGK